MISAQPRAANAPPGESLGATRSLQVTVEHLTHEAMSAAPEGPPDTRPRISENRRPG